MAHTRTADIDARIIQQCARGRRIRNVASIGFSVASARTSNTAPARIMADVIGGETEKFPFFIAPCDCKVIRITANGTPFVDNDTGETSTAKLTKAVIGGTDVDLCSAITIGSATAPTADTAIDATLSSSDVLNLVEGQHVYATVTIGNTVQTAVAYITLMMEWVPMDLQ
jgi:hypothetical protein